MYLHMKLFLFWLREIISNFNENNFYRIVREMRVQCVESEEVKTSSLDYLQKKVDHEG